MKNKARQPFALKFLLMSNHSRLLNNPLPLEDSCLKT
jgi:hypothetical protein